MKRIGLLFTALAFVPLLAFAPAERTAPAQWALIVGVGEYPNLGEEGQLPGAVYDALAVRDVLIGRWGFEPENVRLLLNEQATRAGIRAGITEWLPSVARPGDQITLFFAGHGSQIWAEEGASPDGLHQTIAPYDVSMDSADMDIVDRELGEWLRALPTQNVVFFFDSCHSGRITTRDVTPFSRTRVLDRSLDRLERPATAARRALPGAADARGLEVGGARILELSATQPHQVAVEVLFPGEGGGDPFHGGAFSTYLVQRLWRAPASATYRDVFADVRDALKRNRFEQDPHLSEEHPGTSQPLFFVEGRARGGDAFVPVTAIDGSSVEIGAGRALGITVGSLFEVDGGGRVLVESVSRDRSRGSLVSAEGGAVGSGSSQRTSGGQARLAAYRYPVAPLLVNVAGVDSVTRAGILAAAEGMESLVAVEDGEDFSHLLLRRRANDIRVIGADGSIRHTFPATTSGTRLLVEALHREAAAKRLADMDNLGQRFAMRVSLSGGKTTFGIGELVTFHARSERDGYLTLVDLGTDGTVTVLFPNPYDRDNRVRAGQDITFPTATMESEIVAMPPSGRGMVRAFLTPEPLDIPLGDDFTSGNHLLADRIAEAVKSAAGRVAEAPEAVRLESWGTASLTYDIRR
jgi:hypothetical protein